MIPSAPAQRPGPNQPCWCGMPRKYKHCHRSIDDAAPEAVYAASQAVYVSSWRTTADAQHRRGDYAWMARQLLPFGIRRLLDVGCGSGHGLLSILDEIGVDLRIVAIDENPSCLDVARDTLRSAGFEAPPVDRRITTVRTPFGFRSAAAPIAGALPTPIALVQADVCSDPSLEAALLGDGPFDAVTVWLSGVHMYRQFNEVVVGAGVDSDPVHRLFVQNSVYELADKVLRPGGVLQVVDRGETPSTPELLDDVMDAHRRQAGPTSLDVRHLGHAPWTPPNPGRVPMVSTPGSSGRAPGADVSIVSVVSVKT